VYHVQSEAREADLLLQTQVFVRGRCIGKRATSYADRVAEPGFADEQMHELLKAQHRLVLEAVREGKVESLLAEEVQDYDGHGLAVHWTNAQSVYTDNAVVLRFQVSDRGSPVEGAKLTTRFAVSSQAPIYTQAVTDTSGATEIKVLLEESSLPEAVVLVQATHEGKSATRKFRLRRG
jgi:methionine synthase I (cobalamin-dependent)